jgi:hypothetical protein
MPVKSRLKLIPPGPVPKRQQRPSQPRRDTSYLQRQFFALSRGRLHVRQATSNFLSALKTEDVRLHIYQSELKYKILTLAIVVHMQAPNFNMSYLASL